MHNMRILKSLVSTYENSIPLEGKTVLVCTHTATVQLVSAITKVGANVVYVPIQYSMDKSVLNDIGNISNVKKT